MNDNPTSLKIQYTFGILGEYTGIMAGVFGALSNNLGAVALGATGYTLSRYQSELARVKIEQNLLEEILNKED